MLKMFDDFVNNLHLVCTIVLSYTYILFSNTSRVKIVTVHKINMSVLYTELREKYNLQNSIYDTKQP